MEIDSDAEAKNVSFPPVLSTPSPKTNFERNRREMRLAGRSANVQHFGAPPKNSAADCDC